MSTDCNGRERPSLVGDLYNGLHSFFSALLRGGIFMKSLSPDKRASHGKIPRPTRRQRYRRQPRNILPHPRIKSSPSSSKDKKFAEPGAEAPVLPHRALFVLCSFFPASPVVGAFRVPNNKSPLKFTHPLNTAVAGTH